MDTIAKALELGAEYAWGTWLVVLSVGTGFIFSLVCGVPQVRRFIQGWKLLGRRSRERTEHGANSGRSISGRAALLTALAGNVGLGNVAGVAVAISVGGPGALLWMWIAAFVGMGTEFVCCSLAVMYRPDPVDGVFKGGPMYYIRLGLGARWAPVAIIFSAFGMIACMGGGNLFQSNQMAAILDEGYGIPTVASAVAITIVVGLVIIGGITRIARVATALVPVMVLLFFIGLLGILIVNPDRILPAIALIFRDAFTGSAAAGGSLGALIIQGVRRATFSNESGLGTVPIAHGASATRSPIEQGLLGMLGPFVDTIVVCSITAVALVVSGVWSNTDVEGITMVGAALNTGIPHFGSYVLPVIACFFAFSTVIAWAYYGERCAEFAFGTKAIVPYRIVYLSALFIGGVWKFGPVLNFSDMMYAFMIVPNLLGAWFLLARARRESVAYFETGGQDK